MVLAVCPTYILVCILTYVTLVDLILCLCALYYACGPYPMLVDLIICLCAVCLVGLYFACGPLCYACGIYKAAEDAITKFKADAAQERARSSPSNQPNLSNSQPPYQPTKPFQHPANTAT